MGHTGKASEAAIHIIIPEHFTVKVQEPLIPTWLYKMVASMKAAIFNCQCAQMQSCEGGCETIYVSKDDSARRIDL